MLKFGALLAIIACVGSVVVAANKLHHYSDEESDNGLEHYGHHGGNYGHSSGSSNYGHGGNSCGHCGSGYGNGGSSSYGHHGLGHEGLHEDEYLHHGVGHHNRYPHHLRHGGLEGGFGHSGGHPTHSGIHRNKFNHGGIRHGKRQQNLRNRHGSGSGISGGSSGSGSGFNSGSSSSGSGSGSGFGGGFRSRRNGSVGGVGAGAIAGASKGVHGHESHSNSIGSKKSGHLNGQAEVHKTDIHGTHDREQAGLVHSGQNDDEGVHKHQVINKDKTIIKDRTTGVNDVEGFHHSNSHTDGAHASREHDNIDAHNVGGSISGNAGFEKEFDAENSGEQSFDANSSVGGAKGIGAAKISS